jgi:hypothetical protein
VIRTKRAGGATTVSQSNPHAAGKPTSVPQRHHRLDELIWHLTECEPGAATAALRASTAAEPYDFDAAITAVAGALVRLRARVPATVA